jgi:hypothetical protein
MKNTFSGVKMVASKSEGNRNEKALFHIKKHVAVQK